MNSIIILLISVLGIFILWQLRLLLRSKKSVGGRIPFNKIGKDLLNNIENNSGIIYFFSPNCFNCKRQDKIINEIKDKFANVYYVDVSRDYKSSRAFCVWGTPSLVFIDGNKILGHYVGIKDKEFILRKLKKR